MTILEKLSAETGRSLFYDEDAAQDWFEDDDESAGLIVAAGFSEVSWKEAFDQTMTGFIASIPPAGLEQMKEAFADRLGEADHLSQQQQQAAAEMLRSHMADLDVLRKKGAPYRSMVTPHAARLKLLSRQE